MWTIVQTGCSTAETPRQLVSMQDGFEVAVKAQPFFEDAGWVQEVAVKAQPKSWLLPSSQKHPTTLMALLRSSRRGPRTNHLSSR